MYRLFNQSPESAASLPWQYGDFSAWQRETQDDSRQTAKLAYWIERLRDAPPVWATPDFPRTAAQTFNGSSVLHAGSPTCGSWKGWGVVMAPVCSGIRGFSALVSRLSGQTDVVVGTPVADASDVEPPIGLFINTLPLSGRRGNPAFQALSSE